MMPAGCGRIWIIFDVLNFRKEKTISFQKCGTVTFFFFKLRNLDSSRKFRPIVPIGTRIPTLSVHIFPPLFPLFKTASEFRLKKNCHVCHNVKIWCQSKHWSETSQHHALCQHWKDKLIFTVFCYKILYRCYDYKVK